MGFGLGFVFGVWFGFRVRVRFGVGVGVGVGDGVGAGVGTEFAVAVVGSEEHTFALQSLRYISYAASCLNNSTLTHNRCTRI